MAGIMGGRMTRPKVDRCQWGGVWGGCPIPSRLEGLGERRAGVGAELSRRWDFGYFENHRTLLFVTI